MTFVPIQDIEGYVRALTREGFYTADQIEEIRKKHEAHLKPLVEKPLSPVRMHYIPILTDKESVYIKYTLTPKGKVKIKIVAPFDEYNTLVKKLGFNNVPPMAWIKACALNGASKEYCKCLMISSKLC